MVENLINFPMMAVVEKSIQKPIHTWDLKPLEATALQAGLSRWVVRQTRISPEDMDTVAGVDTGYRNDTAYAAVVVVNLTDMKILEEAVAAKPVQFPYVVLKSCRGYRLPEPIRRADHLSRKQI